MSKAESYEEMLEALVDELGKVVMRARVRAKKAGVVEACHVCKRPFRDAERLLAVAFGSEIHEVVCIDREACRARVIGAKHLADAQEVARRKAVVEAVNL